MDGKDWRLRFVQSNLRSLRIEPAIDRRRLWKQCCINEAEDTLSIQYMKKKLGYPLDETSVVYVAPYTDLVE
jgi:hypothetical protein